MGYSFIIWESELCVTVAEADIETIRCIMDNSRWEMCIRLKKAREALTELELRVLRLIEALP